MIELVEIARLKKTSLKKVMLREKIMSLTLKGILIPFLTSYLLMIIKTIIG